MFKHIIFAGTMLLAYQNVFASWVVFRAGEIQCNIRQGFEGGFREVNVSLPSATRKQIISEKEIVFPAIKELVGERKVKITNHYIIGKPKHNNDRPDRLKLVYELTIGTLVLVQTTDLYLISYQYLPQTQEEWYEYNMNGGSRAVTSQKKALSPFILEEQYLEEIDFTIACNQIFEVPVKSKFGARLND